MSTQQDTFDALVAATINDLKAAIPGDWDAGDIDYESQAIEHNEDPNAFISVTTTNPLTVAVIGPGPFGGDVIRSRNDLNGYLARLRQHGYRV